MLLYIAIALTALFIRISEVRLLTHSIVFWVMLVLQQYINYALMVHHSASDNVSFLSPYLSLSLSLTFFLPLPLSLSLSPTLSLSHTLSLPLPHDFLPFTDIKYPLIKLAYMYVCTMHFARNLVHPAIKT